MGRARCTLAVQGLDCPNEERALRDAIGNHPGVAGLEFDLLQGRMTVEYDPSVTTPRSLAGRVTQATGLQSELLAGSLPELATIRGETGITSRSWWSAGKHWMPTILAGLGLLLGLILDGLGRLPGLAHAGFALAIAAGGVELLPKAVRSLRGRRLDIHVLMTLAVVGAMALGLWDEAATVAFLFGLSEALEAMSLARARNAVRSLLEVTPETAERIRSDGDVERISARLVQAGDRLRVRSGGRIPVDGRVILGRSTVDLKAITGESVPVLREPGDPVYAGAINGDGALEIEATKALDDSMITHIVERVRAAQKGRTPSERVIERFARVYTPIVVGLALLVMVAPPLFGHFMGTGGVDLWRTWIFRGLVVLVISCPCALVIGTPVAVVSALACAARRGVLIKSGEHLEAFGRLKLLAFDKTGTLTRGEPAVVEVVPFARHGVHVENARQDGDDLLRIAAALGDRGGHVLGRAIARHARDRQLEVPLAADYEAVPGLGAAGHVEEARYHIGSHRYIDEAGLCDEAFHERLEAAESNVGTSVALTSPAGPLGWIRLADRARPEAAATFAELHELGLETVLLTGDNPPTAAAMADELGIREHHAGLLPGDKADILSGLDQQRGPAGMVGDGVNDAPALAAARVSVAMGGLDNATAMETADIVLMGEDLSALPWLVRHSRRTLARIRQNIALAVGSKALVLVLAIAGYAGFWLAIASDVGVSLLVVANALRLLRGS